MRKEGIDIEEAGRELIDVYITRQRGMAGETTVTVS
jgi:hypothetical protein